MRKVADLGQPKAISLNEGDQLDSKVYVLSLVSYMESQAEVCHP